MDKLVARAGADKGAEFPLDGDIVRLGRNPENDISLNDGAASRFHCEVRRRDGCYYVRDLGSTHGTFVNDVRDTTELPLNPGDVIRIGNTELVFHGQAPKTPPVGQAPKRAETPPGMSTETIAFSVAAGTDPTGVGLSEKATQRLSRVADAIKSVLDLDELLGKLMDCIFEVFKPERGVLLLREAQGDQLVPQVVRPEGAVVETSQTVIDHAIEKRMALLVSDMRMDERFSGAESIMAQSIVSAICCPLVSRHQVLGVLYIDAQSHVINYERDDLALLNIIATNAAIAVENAILVRQKLEAERLAAIGVAMAGIAHYVKNILFGIKGSASLIEQGISTDNFETVKKIWPVQERSVRKISVLVQDMLTYSKKREPEWEDGNLNDVLREIHQSLAARAQEVGVSLVLELDKDLPDSQFDPKAVHDTLLNIAGNAIDACEGRENQRVVIRSGLWKGGPRLGLWIVDSGPGIPVEIQKKIFEPFFSTKGSKGTGLGLAVAHKVIEEHGGQLLVESEPGKGTTFSVCLPRAASVKTIADN